jgi:D-amino-acid dehydrogenase
MKFDEYVFAAGPWTNYLCNKIGIKLLLQSGKGYSMDVHEETKINLPAILVEPKCAVTPMNGFTRFSGTIEIASINNNIRRNRVDAIANSACSYYPNLKIDEDIRSKAAFGLRAISADGLPYIGRSSKISNIVIATGHNMTGWSMSTGTGKLVSDFVSEKPPSIDTSFYNPERKF